MKNLILLLAALVMGTGSSFGANMHSTVTTALNTRSFIFTEGDITFSVYPDGEFDFYLNGQAGVFGGRGAITFNSGFNYNPYVQYDDFGAVIQIAQLPVFYDYYGRVNRIGNVYMTYRNGRLNRLGGMRIFYNGMGYYNYHVGYINPFNRVYVYQPFHRYFVRPAAAFCMVYPRPYRHFYTPVRYTYHRPYHNNVRRAYARVGQPHKYQNRAQRSRVYQNDRRVVARSNQRSVAGRNATDRTIKANRAQRSAANRTATAVRSKSTVKNSRSRANTRRNTAAVKTQSVAKRSRGIARTSTRKAARVSTPARSQRNASAAKAIKQGRTGKSTMSRSGSQKSQRAVTRSSPDRAKRSATASKRTDTRTSRTSRRSPR